MNLQEMINRLRQNGYSAQDAESRVCQDVVLKAIASSTFSRNVTIKGGVVMRSITGNVRRTTQDMDIDFIRYSLSDESIDNFLQHINILPNITIQRIGKITELNQQDYRGKRVYILISDDQGTTIESKIDLGVHNHLDISQEEYCFDIAYSEEGASLLINTKEQMFTEKLRSLLKFGTFSTRYKDIYDMYYHCDKLNQDNLYVCLVSYIYSDPGMRENNIQDVAYRINKVLSDQTYKSRVDKSDKRWLDEDIDIIFDGIRNYINSLMDTE